MDTAAQAIGHEAQHDIDTEQWGEASDEKAFRRTETNAYTTQAAIERGFGMRLLSSDMAAAIESSVQLDLHQVGQRSDSANKMKDNERN